MKIPEFPPDFLCCHCATSSKFLKVFLVRITPIGFPVQYACPSSHLQVSGSQFTLVKSSPPNDLQPGPSPSMNALRGFIGSSVRARLAAKAKNTRPATRAKPRNDFIELLVPLNKGGKKARDNSRETSGNCHHGVRETKS